MSRIWILSGWLMVGCSLSTLLAFLASVHPQLKLWVGFLWAVFLVAQILGWLADDGWAAFFHLDTRTWWGILVLSAVCAVVGLSLWLLS